MAECSADITPYTDKNWMNLYIDVDEGYNGWETFDYVVGKNAAGANQTTLEKFTGNGYETSLPVDVDYKVSGNKIVVKIAKESLGISGNEYKIGFKWTDNVQDEDGSGQFKGEILDFYRTGDVAPGGRFKYVYKFAGAADVETTPVVTDVVTAPTEDTTTAPETTNNTETEPQNSGNTILIIAISIAAAAIAVLAIVIIIKNKKK